MHLRDPLTGRLRSVRAHPFGFLAMGGDARAHPVDADLHHAAAGSPHGQALEPRLGGLRLAALRRARHHRLGGAARARAADRRPDRLLRRCSCATPGSTSRPRSTPPTRPSRCSRRSRSSCRSRSTSRCSPTATCARRSASAGPSTPIARCYRVPLARDEREPAPLGDKLDAQTPAELSRRGDARERRDGAVDVVVGERGRELGADARLALAARPGRRRRRRRRRARAAARRPRSRGAASPNITGTIGCSPGRTSKPSAASSRAEARGVARTAARAAPAPSVCSRSSTASYAATIGGARVFENRYGRERWRSSSTISRRAARVAAAGAAERLAERAGDDVDAVGDAVQLGRAAAVGADEADGVGVVDHHQRVVAARRARRCAAAARRSRPSRTRRRWRSAGGGRPRPRCSRSSSSAMSPFA